MSIADKLTQIAENTQSVYDSGYNNGFSTGFDKAMHDFFYTFWDNFQQNGTRKHYAYAFSGRGWNNATFTPQYDIKPTESFSRGMAHTLIEGSLTEILNRCGVVLDTSGMAYCDYVFDSSTSITEIPLIVGHMQVDGLFQNCFALQTAALDVEERTRFTNTFFQCRNLENLTISGTIGENIDLQYSTKLSYASIESVVNHLSDNVSGKSVTFSYEAVGSAFNWDFGGSWSEFIATKPNWTISFV